VHSRQRAADGGRRTADNEVSLLITDNIGESRDIMLVNINLINMLVNINLQYIL
jgi:hypothetical protein